MRSGRFLAPLVRTERREEDVKCDGRKKREPSFAVPRAGMSCSSFEYAIALSPQESAMCKRQSACPCLALVFPCPYFSTAALNIEACGSACFFLYGAVTPISTNPEHGKGFRCLFISSFMCLGIAFFPPA